MSDTNGIKIKARKISDIATLTSDNFTFENQGDDSYLLISYKPTEGTAQNFKMSINTIIDKIKNSIENISITDTNFAVQLSRIVQSNNDVKNLFISLIKEYGSVILQSITWNCTLPSNANAGSSFNFNKGTITANYSDGTTVDVTNDATININNGATISGTTINVPSVTRDTVITLTASYNGKITTKTFTAKYEAPVLNINYLFSYASEELQEGIFTKDANGTIIDVDVTALKALSWTQEVTGKVPTTNKNGHGFCLQDYNTTYSESYVWDEAVENGRVWIILPAKFYNIQQKNFIDEKNRKWKFVDPMVKNPMNPALDPITITGLYEEQDYILVCFSEEGQVDEQYFKKIG